MYEVVRGRKTGLSGEKINVRDERRTTVLLMVAWGRHYFSVTCVNIRLTPHLLSLFVES